MLRQTVATLCALGALSTTAVAQFDVQQSTLGVSAGAFFPTDGELRDLMGDRWISFGLGTSDQNFDTVGQTFDFDWNVLTQDNNGNKIFFLTPSAGFIFPLSDPGANTRPYVATRAGLSYMDYAITRPGTGRFGAKKIGFNGNVELGVNVGRNLSLAARYDLYSEQDAFNFNGLSVELTYGFFSF